MEAAETKDFKEVLLLLVLGSLLILGNAIFTVQIFSIQYGLGAGATIQSTADKMNISSVLSGSASEIQMLYNLIMESYIEVLLAIILFAISLVMWIRRSPKNESYKKTYILSHAAITIIYVLLFFIIYSNTPSLFYGLFQYVGYFGIVLVLLSDIYLEYFFRRQHATVSRSRRTLSIDPSTPYTNLINIREQIFKGLTGNVYIVDKHLNSAALSNLNRLFSEENGTTRSINILTSAEMFDSGFNVNYNDLRNEFQNRGITVDVWIMDSKDSSSQHERFIADDNSAFKIPPLNIINRKSEHVVRMKVSDARSRYKYLMRGAIKLENYKLKKSRNDESSPDVTVKQ